MNKKALVLGCNGFIGKHICGRLLKDGYQLLGVARNTVYSAFQTINMDLECGDLQPIIDLFKPDEVYQMAANVGGANYINNGSQDLYAVQQSLSIDLNIIKSIAKCSHKNFKLFYPSTACVYNKSIINKDNPICKEEYAYPADPENEYGWIKLTGERLYTSLANNTGIKVRIGRFHNIYGVGCQNNNKKEKAHAALCRKICNVKNGDYIDVIGDGEQIRTFLYVEDCVDAVFKLMKAEINTPINIGSDIPYTINNYIKILRQISGKQFAVRHQDGPIGSTGRVSDNTELKKMGWYEKQNLHDGTLLVYNWIKNQ